jgi:hypothetical protein
MSKISKTQSILKDKKIKSDLKEQGSEGATCVPCKAKQEAIQKEETCLPCQAKKSTIWRVYVHHHDFFGNPQNAEANFKLLGDALQQFANFTATHVQSIFISMSLLPSEWYLIYSGSEDISNQLHNALASIGMRPKIEASLKTF